MKFVLGLDGDGTAKVEGSSSQVRITIQLQPGQFNKRQGTVTGYLSYKVEVRYFTRSTYETNPKHGSSDDYSTVGFWGEDSYLAKSPSTSN